MLSLSLMQSERPNLYTRLDPILEEYIIKGSTLEIKCCFLCRNGVKHGGVHINVLCLL